MSIEAERKVRLMSISGQGNAHGAVNSRTKPPRIENTKGGRPTEQPCGRCEGLMEKYQEATLKYSDAADKALSEQTMKWAARKRLHVAQAENKEHIERIEELENRIRGLEWALLQYTAGEQKGE